MSEDTSVFRDSTDARLITVGVTTDDTGADVPIRVDYRAFRFGAHVVGGPGSGKTAWVCTVARELLGCGAGFMALDGRAHACIPRILAHIPLERERDVRWIDLDGYHDVGLDLRVTMNMLTTPMSLSPSLRGALLAAQMTALLRIDAVSQDAPRGDDTVCDMALQAVIGSTVVPTLLDLLRFCTDDAYRDACCQHLPAALHEVRAFWLQYDLQGEDAHASLDRLAEQLDRYLPVHHLHGLLCAPYASIDMRQVMDTNGIVLMEMPTFPTTQALFALAVVLTQLRIAALSRSALPEPQRRDWPLLIDNVEFLPARDARGFAQMMRQFTTMHVGQVYAHRLPDALDDALVATIACNAGSRIVLKAPAVGANTRPTLALHLHDGRIFAHARPVSMGLPLQETCPPPVAETWHTVTAPATTRQDTQVDDAIAQFHALAHRNRDEAVQRLGLLALRSPAVFDAYCARTRTHREAQRQFILDHPGCIAIDHTLAPEQAWLKQKRTRIRVLSALHVGVPQLEIDAWTWQAMYRACGDTSE